MPSHSEIKNLPYSAKQMFDLVLDVEKYPEFLPWCLAAKITKKLDAENFEADLAINFKGFTQKYSSNIQASQNNNSEFLINVSAIDGPFKNLTNRWQFRNIAGGCQVEFFIDFEFKSMILGKMIGMIFEKATDKMIDAFENRAQTIYK
ncbi:MAG: type II toxin-antitoxin system RatA family toxin [Pseudomonadota bacterium]